MIRTRNRLHSRLSSSGERFMLVRSTELGSRRDNVRSNKGNVGVHEIESEVQRSTSIVWTKFKPYTVRLSLKRISTTTYTKTLKVRRKPMQGLNGVPSRPFACCLVALALPSPFWPLCQWGKRVTAHNLERSVPLSLPPRVVQTESRLPLDRVPSNIIH